MGTVNLLAGMAVFFGVHSVSIVAPAWRDRMVARLGEPAWKGVYAIASIVGFILMIRGYSHAKLEPTVVYEPAYWLRHLAAIVMVPVFPLLLSAYFPGRIKAAAQHPMLAATKLWAVAHLLASPRSAPGSDLALPPSRNHLPSPTRRCLVHKRCGNGHTNLRAGSSADQPYRQ